MNAQYVDRLSRTDRDVILTLVPEGVKVLDLGCGDCNLLSELADKRNIRGTGVDIRGDQLVDGLARGFNVYQGDLDEGLADFPDNAYDYVILNQTLQVVKNPLLVFNEMLRIGREGIVTFPNFGHWRSRVQLALGGRMPLSPALPNEWYNTPNIHLCTLKDFEILCARLGLQVLQRTVVDHAHRDEITFLPNLMGEIALYRIQRG